MLGHYLTFVIATTITDWKNGATAGGLDKAENEAVSLAASLINFFRDMSVIWALVIMAVGLVLMAVGLNGSIGEGKEKIMTGAKVILASGVLLAFIKVVVSFF